MALTAPSTSAGAAVSRSPADTRQSADMPKFLPRPPLLAIGSNLLRRSHTAEHRKQQEIVDDLQHAGGDQWPAEAGKGEKPAGEHRARRRGQAARDGRHAGGCGPRSEEHTSELQSLMRNSYAGFCLKKKKTYRT